MKKGKSYTVAYRRKREGRTNYRARIKLLSSDKNRVVLRKGINNFVIQIIEHHLKGDKVLVSSHTRELIKYGWKSHRGNISSAYLTGLLCGIKAKKKGIKSGVTDVGFFRIVKGSCIFAAIKGLRDSGFAIAASEDFFPNQDRISGKHIQEFASKIKGSPLYNIQFSNLIKNGLKPEEFTRHFDEIKGKVLANDK